MWTKEKPKGPGRFYYCHNPVYGDIMYAVVVTTLNEPFKPHSLYLMHERKYIEWDEVYPGWWYYIPEPPPIPEDA